MYVTKQKSVGHMEGWGGKENTKPDKLNAHQRLDLFVCRQLHSTLRPKCSGPRDPVLQTAHV